MEKIEAQVGEKVLGDRYILLHQVKGSLGGGRLYVGSEGQCRYCGSNDEKKFRKLAHTFPEALGNKWVFSIDECDCCNQTFSVYEDALTKSVSPFLTLGGVKGKGNKTRQTGRTAGDSVIKHHWDSEKRRGISMSLNRDEKDWSDYVSIDPIRNRLKLLHPIANIPFRPRYAYKAIAKMGVAMLPAEELTNFRKLRAWLLDVNDKLNFPYLEVGVSFGSIGNSPSLVCGSLLRRVHQNDEIPYILFVLTAGSVCLQIDLMSDHQDDHVPPILPGVTNVNWSNILEGPAGRESISIIYRDPIFLNWAPKETKPQPIEAIMFDYCTKTHVGEFFPIFRGQTPKS